MKLTTEELDKLADLGAKAALAALEDESWSVTVSPKAEHSYPADALARRAFVESIIANAPQQDWPLTRDAFASRGITTDEAAADWVSITHDTRIAKPVPTFGKPPEGWEWHNPQNLTPEQVEVDKGWRLMLVGEAVPDGYEFINFSKTLWSEGEDWFGKKAGVGDPGNFWVKNTYRTKAPLLAPITPAEAAFNDWWDAQPDRDGIHKDRCKTAFLSAFELSTCKQLNS